MDADNNGVTDKDDEGKYIVDEASAEYYCELVESYADANYSNYEGTSTDEKKAAAKKDRAIEIVFSDYFGEDGKTYNYSRIQEVVAYRETAVNLITEFTADARSEYLAGERRVQNISGITTERVTEFNGKKLDGTYDVLKIKINGVDPKAKWNFGFNVSPLHYYSTHNYNGKDYIAAFDGVTEFGLEFGSKEFMDAVVNSVDKNGIPVGAGPYKASRESGTEGMTEKYVSATEFRRNNIIYFERNTNFESLGGSIHNAKIKYLRYQVINSNQIFNTLQRGSIDFGELTAKASVIEDLNNSDSLGYSLTDANGYGYVGVNAKYVPDVNVRRAIMMAMDPTLITSNYYTNGLAQVIYRPMSKVSWAYPDGAEPYYTYDNSGDKILQMLLDAGVHAAQCRNGTTCSSARWRTESSRSSSIPSPFRAVRKTTPHGACSRRRRRSSTASALTSPSAMTRFALSKLSSGLLTVWAAAWSSTIDPDMYQVYHKDSTATSTLNWGIRCDQGQSERHLYLRKGARRRALRAHRRCPRDGRSAPPREHLFGCARSRDGACDRIPALSEKGADGVHSSKIDRNTLTPESELSPYNSLLSRIWEMGLRQITNVCAPVQFCAGAQREGKMKNSMLRYVIKRLLLAIVILIGVSVIIYSLSRLMPQDYIDKKFEPQITQGLISRDEVERIKELYGLGDNSFAGILLGYLKWIGNVFRGDLGTSFIHGQKVTTVIFENMGISFGIAFVAMILEFLIAVPLGIKAATNQYGKVDYTATVLAMMGISLPTFFLGAIMIKIFSVDLGWFPVNGLTSPGLSVDATGWERFWGHDVAPGAAHGHARHPFHRRAHALYAHQYAGSAQCGLYPYRTGKGTFGKVGHLQTRLPQYHDPARHDHRGYAAEPVRRRHDHRTDLCDPRDRAQGI